MDPGDKGSPLVRTANANGAALSSNTSVANVNIVITYGKVFTSFIS
jgi:hypothetical protein